jgi:oxalate decarboxylase
LQQECVLTFIQAEEWLYFVSGNARATVFIGNAAARTFDFSAGDTGTKSPVESCGRGADFSSHPLPGVFPDNSGHYVENTSDSEDLVWIEIYKSDRVVDISLAQWLALTPPGIVASTLKIPIEFVETLKKEKQLIVA